jgi:hypothetical protein
MVRVIRQLAESQTAPLLADPRNTLDLMISAVNGWLLAYDNISTLPNWLSDSLCRLASGGGFATRALYSNDDRNVIYAQRPVILNGINKFIRNGDLVDRSVFLHVPAITSDARREEREFWRAFRALHPQLLGDCWTPWWAVFTMIPAIRKWQQTNPSIILSTLLSGRYTN